MKYFQHDTNTRTNRKIRKVIRTHGPTGIAVWWTLLEELYQADESGFQVEANELWLESFAKSLCIPDYRILIRIFDTFAEVGLISAQQWKEKTIHSRGFAKRAEEFLRERERARERAKASHIYRKHESFVFSRDNFACVYCGATENLTLDHVIPQSKGGSHKPENLACCCSSCNSSKQDRTPQEWRGGVA